jgi:5S rRNA maturation endonuclease (ribonuclease M5)
MDIKQVLDRLKKVHRNSKGWSARCPAHDDKRNSLSVSEGEDGKVLFKCHAGCSYAAIIAALGLATHPASQKKTVAEYTYQDEKGKTLYQAIRTEPKSFRVRRPDGIGKWVWNIEGVRRVLYHLPEVIASDKQEPVYIVEGEKDADRLKSLGLITTTNVGGAGKWREEYSEYLRGRHTVIIPDNDAAGRKHAELVAQSLRNVAASVKVVPLPNLSEKGDFSDWLEAGGTVEQLHELVELAPFHTPSVEPSVKLGRDTYTNGRQPSQSTRLVALADKIELFHSPDGDAYASMMVNGHLETWPLRSKGFRRYLMHRFYEEYGQTPAAQPIQDALGLLEGKALYKGPEHPINIRLAEYQGCIYIDLADAAWQVVKVAADGWSITTSQECSVKFRRVRGMLALPEPTQEGSITKLRSFINVENDGDWTLLLAWLVAALRPRGPYPVLVLHGEQGSAKSTLARVLRSLIDPNVAALRSQPRNEHDLVIAANNGSVVALDNLSYLPDWLSDSICRLSTGGGFGTRTLYENDEETLFNSTRPVLLNGIEELATRGDLLDRAIVLYLPAIPREKRRSEVALWREFEQAHPSILGALCDAVSIALHNADTVRLERLPRMADFAIWATAAESALGIEIGGFIDAYTDNCEGASGIVLESSPVAAAMFEFAASITKWSGTATDLLNKLNLLVSETVRQQQSWPKKPAKLSNVLRRLAPNLRQAGIAIEFSRDRGRTRRRTIVITSTLRSQDYGHELPSASSAPSAQRNSNNWLADDVNGTDAKKQTFSDESEERAAIMEYEGGLIREEAEGFARREFEDIPF